jgi:hypothetical protein
MLEGLSVFPTLLPRADNTTGSSTVDDDSDNYGYIPTLAICVLFIVLFSLSTGI